MFNKTVHFHILFLNKSIKDLILLLDIKATKVSNIKVMHVIYHEKPWRQCNSLQQAYKRLLFQAEHDTILKGSQFVCTFQSG